MPHIRVGANHHDGIRRHVFGNRAAGPDHGAVAQRDRRHQSHV
jgi:hypothetical protein